MILLLQDTFIDSHPQKTQSIQKTFHFNRLCRAFLADHFDNKIFWISLRNHYVIVKILNTVKYRVAQNVCNIVCFPNISAQTNDKIFTFFFKRCTVKRSRINVSTNPYQIVLMVFSILEVKENTFKCYFPPYLT